MTALPAALRSPRARATAGVLVACALALSALPAHAARLYVVADGTDAPGLFRVALNSAVASPGANAVLFKDSQVRRLTEPSMRRELADAQRLGLPVYVCKADLEHFGVSARSLPEYVVSIESRPEPAAAGEPPAPVPQWPAVPYIKQMVKACEPL